MSDAPLPEQVEQTAEGLTWTTKARHRSELEQVLQGLMIMAPISLVIFDFGVWMLALAVLPMLLLLTTRDRIQVDARSVTVRRTGPLRLVAPDLDLPLVDLEQIEVQRDNEQKYYLVLTSGEEAHRLGLDTKEEDQAEAVAEAIRAQTTRALPVAPRAEDQEALDELDRLQQARTAAAAEEHS